MPPAGGRTTLTRITPRVNQNVSGLSLPRELILLPDTPLPGRAHHHTLFKQASQSLLRPLAHCPDNSSAPVTAHMQPALRSEHLQSHWSHSKHSKVVYGSRLTVSSATQGTLSLHNSTTRWSGLSNIQVLAAQWLKQEAWLL